MLWQPRHLPGGGRAFNEAGGRSTINGPPSPSTPTSSSQRPRPPIPVYVFSKTATECLHCHGPSGDGKPSHCCTHKRCPSHSRFCPRHSEWHEGEGDECGQEEIHSRQASPVDRPSNGEPSPCPYPLSSTSSIGTPSANPSCTPPCEKTPAFKHDTRTSGHTSDSQRTHLQRTYSHGMSSSPPSVLLNTPHVHTNFYRCA